MIEAFIYPASLLAVLLMAHYWWHLSDTTVAVILAVMVGGHLIDGLEVKLDTIVESIDSIKEALETRHQ